MLVQKLYDLSLLRYRLQRTGAATTSRPGGKIDWRRTVLVLASHIGPTLEQGSHSRRTTRAHGAVQGCHSLFVGRVRIGASLDEASDHCGLGRRIPRARAGRTDNGIVKRLSTEPIARANVGVHGG